SRRRFFGDGACLSGRAVRNGGGRRFRPPLSSLSSPPYRRGAASPRPAEDLANPVSTRAVPAAIGGCLPSVRRLYPRRQSIRLRLVSSAVLFAPSWGRRKTEAASSDSRRATKPPVRRRFDSLSTRFGV